MAAGGALPHVLTLQRLAHASDGLERELEHERCLEPQHPIAETSQSPVPLRVRGATGDVIAAIDLDDEPSGRSCKVSDEPPEHHLPAKPNPELPAAKVKPERLLGRRGSRAQPDGALNDDGMMSPRMLG